MVFFNPNRSLENDGNNISNDRFGLNNKWGLRIDGRVTVPPIYRSVRPPVGKYCAIEMNYSQWGVVALDGTVMVAPQYADIEISTQGVVTGIRVTGSKEEIHLP